MAGRAPAAASASPSHRDGVAEGERGQQENLSHPDPPRGPSDVADEGLPDWRDSEPHAPGGRREAAGAPCPGARPPTGLTPNHLMVTKGKVNS